MRGAARVPDQPPKPPRRPGPGLRADARRNLDKLRAAAAGACSERGLDMPLEQIAARRSANPITLCDGCGIDFVTVTGRILIT